ncbi:MAG TPA: hypothetical protein VHA75_01265, partial [Rugosimonospora sp.]|nr:hypothetical protein [Rugosimonospora sp.]
SDRGIRRLAVTRIDPGALEPVDGPGPSVAADASLREALSALLVGGTGRVLVHDADGVPLGQLTPATIASAAVTAPDAR